MKLSRFSILLDMNEYGAFFNGVTGCLDLVSRSLFHALKDLPERTSGALRDSVFGIDLRLLSALETRGHLTEASDTEELAQFRRYAILLDRQNRWLDKQIAYIMLLLSYYCNLDCSYCFQKDFRKSWKNNRLRPPDVDLIFDRYREYLCPGVDADKIRYVLYGGEPLLLRNMDSVRRILQRAEDQGSAVHAVSNGYNLDAFLPLLGQGKGKISKLQMSFSSDQSVHDTVRVLRSGRPTFMHMLENAEKAIKTGVTLVIRVHMHDNCDASFRLFLTLLEERGILGSDNVIVHAARTKHCSDTFEGDRHYEHPISSEELLRLAPAISSLESCYYQDVLRLAQAKTGRGPAKTVCCMRGKENCYVLDPLGDIYACYEEAGRRQYRVGTYHGENLVFVPFRREVLSGTVANQRERPYQPHITDYWRRLQRPLLEASCVEAPHGQRRFESRNGRSCAPTSHQRDSHQVRARLDDQRPSSDKLCT